MGRSGARRSRQKFSWSSVAGRILEVAREVSADD